LGLWAAVSPGGTVVRRAPRPPLLPTMADGRGGDHPSVGLKSPSSAGTAVSPPTGGSACPCQNCRECGLRGSSCWSSGITWSRNANRQLPTQRFAMPFCRSDGMLVRVGFRSVAFRNSMTSTSNFESRSRILSDHPKPANENRNRDVDSDGRYTLRQREQCLERAKETAGPSTGTAEVDAGAPGRRGALWAGPGRDRA